MNTTVNTDKLVWMDLEMTGLDPEQDQIIEIATVVTDNNLEVVETGPCLIINAPESRFEQMDDWNKNQHTASGLWAKVVKSDISVADAEIATLDFIRKHVPPNIAPLCGNSIWQDRRFIRRYMPNIDSYLHYRMVDVSSIKELVGRWYPSKRFTDKDSGHRAYDDIMQSIKELKHYRTHVFQAT